MFTISDSLDQCCTSAAAANGLRLRERPRFLGQEVGQEVGRTRSQDKKSDLTRDSSERNFESSLVAIDRHSPRQAIGHVDFASARSPKGHGKKRPIAGSVQRVAARQPEDTPGDPRQPETARLATISGSVIMTSRIDAHHRGPAHP